jgi:hypothetical protein
MGLNTEWNNVVYYSGTPKCGRGQPISNRNLKKQFFLGKMVSTILRNLPFNRNQPLKTADDRYTRILKDKIKISYGVLDEITKNTHADLTR